MPSAPPPAPSPVLARAQQSAIVRVVEPRGKLEVWLPRSDVCLSLVEGHLSTAMAKRWVEVMDRRVRAGSVFDTFHDWERMTGYDSGARQALTSWIVGSPRSFRSAGFLVTNPLVRMGVTAASVAVALAGLKMEAFPDRAAFEAALGRFV